MTFPFLFFLISWIEGILLRTRRRWNGGSMLVEYSIPDDCSEHVSFIQENHRIKFPPLNKELPLEIERESDRVILGKQVWSSTKFLIV